MAGDGDAGRDHGGHATLLNDAHAFHDAQAAGHDIRESGKGKDANYTVG